MKLAYAYHQAGHPCIASRQNKVIDARQADPNMVMKNRLEGAYHAR